MDADIENLFGRPFDGSPVPYAWLDVTHVKCRREGRVASTVVVTAIGCDAGGWRRVLGVDVVDTESYDTRLAFLRKIRGRGVGGAELVVSDAHRGLVAAAEAFQGGGMAAPHGPPHARLHARGRLLAAQASRGQDRAAGAPRARRRHRDGHAPRDARHAEGVLPEGGGGAGAEPDALAYLGFPPTHWKRLCANNVQEKASREIKRRSRAVQVFPFTGSLVRLADAVMCERDEIRQESR